MPVREAGRWSAGRSLFNRICGIGNDDVQLLDPWIYLDILCTIIIQL